METKRSYLPTNKWLVTQATALSAFATLYLTTKGWDIEESIALNALILQAVVSYLTPNQDTPGGVPTKEVTNA
jgi:hypothetical protein